MRRVLTTVLRQRGRSTNLNPFVQGLALTAETRIRRMTSRVLIVDDDAAQRRFLAALLGSLGHQAEQASGGEAALARLLDAATPRIAAVLLDLNMPDLDGLAVLERLRAAGNAVPVLVQTSDGSISRAVAAMRAGASDFLVKPVGPERLEVTLANALARSSLETEVRRLSRRESDTLSFDELIAEAPATQAAIALARRAARSDIPVLIEGESGTGKEVFARAIHGTGERAGGPFVAVNCGALPAQLVESILFGHEKGAFTGATARRPGKFQEASGGTLFLDEIGELPAEAQVKLLRALQTGEVDPVGAAAPVRVDIRLVSATNRDLARMIAAGTFREDLYYRLGVFPLALPALRDRREDLEALSDMFLARFAAMEEIPISGFSQDALDLVRAAPWPGNVRQLENTIHRAVVLAEGALIRPRDLRGLAADLAPASVDAPGTPPQVSAAPEASGAPATGDEPFLTPEGHIRRLIDLEREAIRRAIALYDGHMSETARRLGIGRSTLYRKLDELRIPPERS